MADDGCADVPAAWLAGVALILVAGVKQKKSGCKDMWLSSGLLVLLAGPSLQCSAALVTSTTQSQSQFQSQSQSQSSEEGRSSSDSDSLNPWLNPWLSNDGGLILRPPGNATNWMRSEGTCSAHPPVEPCRGDRCPSAESNAETKEKGNASQCLPYLQRGSQSECICAHGDGAKRIDTLRKYYLQHCYHYNLWHVLSNTMKEGIARSRQQCYAYLDVITRLDQLAAGFICQFEDIIRRYDCAQSYSQKSTCQQCKVSQFITIHSPRLFYFFFFIGLHHLQASLIWGKKLNKKFPIFSLFHPFFSVFSHPFVIIASIVTGFRAVSEQFYSSNI